MKSLLLVGWLTLFQLLGFCLSDENQSKETIHHIQSGPSVRTELTSKDDNCRQWVDSVMNQLTPEERIAQLFVFTIEPSMAKANVDLLQRVVATHKVGGLLFSGGTLENQVNLTNQAQQAADVPLMITFDGEWGLAMRLKNTPSFPRNMVLGCINDDQLLFEYGREVARQLKEIGVQVNFAPVADVNINPRNPVINTRSFGENPKEVSKKVVAYSRGLESGGVLSVSKHFPGHGDTNVDSHKALPTLPFDRQRLDSIELYPFKEIVRAGLNGVMVGHLYVPALESKANLPSSLSKRIVQGVLVDELGFNGLIFTDALAMKGVAGQSNVSLKALQAGNDIVLTPPSLKRELDAVIAAVKNGEISQKLIDSKCRKVLTYKYQLGLSKKPQIEVNGLAKRIHTPYTDNLMSRMEAGAITLLKNKNNALPLTKDKEQTIAIIETGSGDIAPFVEKAKEFSKVKHITLRKEMTAAQQTEILNSLQNYAGVVVAVTDQKPTAYQGFLNRLTSLKNIPPVSIVYFSRDKSMLQLSKATQDAGSVILAHSKSKSVQIHTAAAMFGNGKIDGKLSASIGSLYKTGDGIILSVEPPVLWGKDKIGFPLLEPAGVKFYATPPVEAGETETSETVRQDTSTVAVPAFEMNKELAAKLRQIDEIAEEGITQKAYPGCQIVVLQDGKLIYEKAFGTQGGLNTRKTKTTDLYDVASLTKTCGTLLAIMKLYDEGKINLTDHVSKHLPWLKGTNKAQITIQDLLYHQSGLPASISYVTEVIDRSSCTGGLYSGKKTANHTVLIGKNTWANPNFKFVGDWVSNESNDDYNLQMCDGLWVNSSFKEHIRKKIIDANLGQKRYRYSDIGFLLLQYIAEEVSGQPLDQYLYKNFYVPMGLTHTTFKPLGKFDKADIVPTTKDNFFRKQVIEGHVHDETAALHGGVAGSAGLFSTAEDVAAIYQMLLNHGIWKGKRYFSESTCQRFLTAKSTLSRRGLGFDKPNANNPQNSPCAESAPASVFGHTGFTGTCAWADPDNNLVFVFLSNRTYPNVLNRKFTELNIRPRIQQAIYDALK